MSSKKNKILSDQHIKELMYTYNNGTPAEKKAAQDEIVLNNQCLITHVIRKNYMPYCNKYYEDMLSAGNIGLIQALPKFDPEKSKPSTFFFFYISHEIFEYISKMVIGTSTHYTTCITKINRAKEYMKNAKGIEEPSIAEIAMQTKLPLETVQAALKISIAASNISFDKDELVDIPSNYNDAPEYIIAQKERKEILYKEISKLENLDQQILCMKYGIGEYGKEFSIKAISEELNVSTEFIRQSLASSTNQLKISDDMRSIFSNHYETTEKLLEQGKISLLPDEKLLDKELDEFFKIELA